MKAEFYITVEVSQRAPGYRNHVPEKIKAKGLTLGKPNRLTKDQIAVKLTIDVPPEAFMAFEPEAVIEIPVNLVQQPNVEVSVDPPPLPEVES